MKRYRVTILTSGGAFTEFFETNNPETAKVSARDYIINKTNILLIYGYFVKEA